MTQGSRLIQSLRFVLAGSLAIAAGGAASAQIGAGRGPIDIRSDRVSFNENARRAIYRGDVDARQGDARLLSDRLDVIFGEGDTPDEIGDVEQIRATGDVFYITPRERARGDRAIYTVEDDRIVMTGDVVVTQGDNVITGRQLVIFVEEGRSQIDGREGRVRTVITQTDTAPENER